MPWRGDPEKKRAYERKYNATYERKLARKLYKKNWRLTHPDKIKAVEGKSRAKAKYKKKQRWQRANYHPKRIEEAMEVLAIINLSRWMTYLKNAPERKLRWAQLKEDLETEMRRKIKIAA